MAIKTVVSIQNDISLSPAEESVLRTSTNTHRVLQVSLPAHEVLRTPTYVQYALGEGTYA